MWLSVQIYEFVAKPTNIYEKRGNDSNHHPTNIQKKKIVSNA